MQSFEGVSYGSIEQTTGEIGPPSNDDRKKCSQRESANNLIAVLTGAGMLSLPYTAAAMGWSAIGLMILLLVIFLYSYVLLANSINVVSDLRQQRQDERKLRPQSIIRDCCDDDSLIDYTVLGKEAFGQNGDKFVLSILGTELFLALVSFYINIGININVIFSGISIEIAILLSGAVASVMSFLDMKTISRFTAGGNIATTLTVLALVISGYMLRHAMNSSTSVEVEAELLNYKGFDVKGIPVSLGVMAYCFGGHGAFPKIYSEMMHKRSYIEAVSIVASFVFCLYAVIIAAGYYYYGEHTKIPVTVNIGRDLYGNELPGSEFLTVIAALGLVCNIQATCPIMVITVSEMVSTVLGNGSDDTANGKREVSSKITLSISLFGLLIALFLREYFLQVCGIVGAFATITSSIFLPITFYHLLYGGQREIAPIIYCLHACIVVFALLAMFFGVTSSVCSIANSHNALCTLTVPSTD